MPAEDLAGDDPGVAAGTHERAEAHRRGDPLRIGRPARPFRLVERGAHRGEHVRAGVAVRDGKDVERVDLVDVGLEVGDRGTEGREEPRAVTGVARHQATSVPLAARSDGPARRCRAGRSRAVRDAAELLVDEAADVDGDLVELATERVAQGPADGRLDLAGDLGDRDAVGDGEVEVDRERGSISTRRPGCARPDPLQDAPDGATAGEAVTPYGAERRCGPGRGRRAG